jgi:cysteine desulfurase NifS/selenium donor protein
MEQIYLDYNATTPVDKEVAETMRPYLERVFGNPSSNHKQGYEARMAVEEARQNLARLLHASADEIVFTSGGSESNNYAIKGVVMANKHKGRHIITSAIEHPAVSEVCSYLQKEGFEVTTLPVDENGKVAPADLEGAIRKDTILITIMHANNEIGTIQDIPSLSRIAKKYNILFHSDAAQSVGKIPVDVQEMGIDLLSVAGHKMYAPKGIGALYIRTGVNLEKLIHGADHERNHRAGTENVLEIVGLGKAAEIALRDLEANMQHYSTLRDKLEALLTEKLPDIRINAHGVERLPNTSSVCIPKVEANSLLDNLQGVAASAGAACHTDSIDVSSVLEAMKVPVEFAMGTIRFSVGRGNDEKQIEEAARLFTEEVEKLRGDQQHDALINSGEVKLTHFTHGLGCACKLRPQDLEQVLRQLLVPDDADVLVGTDTSDDATVYRINEEQALVQTLDFFTPIVDEPYHFGAIAAANALSDVYAMGGYPLFALNIVGFPDKRLPMSVLQEILQGAQDKASEAGISILGGHTVEDTEPKYGMVVTGLVHPEKIIRNVGARPGDALILTKPIGTGILSTASKRGLTSEATRKTTITLMSALNRDAAEAAVKYKATACTDVTGFGLMGHLREMVLGTKTGVTVTRDKVPVIEEARRFATAGIIPGGTKNNLAYVAGKMLWHESVSETEKLILCDAQTSGGLLIAVDAAAAAAMMEELQQKGVRAVKIGDFTAEDAGRIRVI